MDVISLRSIATVVSFLTFLGIVVWAWSGSRAKDFSEAVNLPFEQD